MPHNDPIIVIDTAPSLNALETAVEEFIDYGSTNAVETWWATQSGQALDDLASLLNSSSTNPILLGYSGQKVGDTVTEITTDIGDIFSTLAKGANQTWDLFSGNYNLPTNYDSVTTASDHSSFVVNFPTGGTNPDGSAFQGARLTFSGTNLDPTDPYNANYTITQTQLDILKTPGNYTDIAQSFTVDSNVVVSNQVLQASTLNGFTFTYGNDFIAELTGDVNISTTDLTAPASRFEIRVGDNVALDPTAATDARLYLDGSFSYNLNTDSISSHFSSLGAEIGDISLTVSDLDSTLTDIKNFSPSTWLRDLLASNPTVDMAFSPSASHGMADGTISASASINGTLAYNDLSKDITWTNAGLNINYQNTDTTANLASATITASATDVLSYNVNTQQASGLITGSYSSTGDTSNTRSGNIAIDLAGTNHAPSDITLDNLSVDENSVGAVVGSLSATDTDDGDSHTYTLSGTDAGSFEVVDEQLKLKDSVSADYETRSTYYVTVQATDTGDLTSTRIFGVSVNDVNEAPMEIRLTSSTVDENSAGAVVGALSTTDADSGDSHTFTLSGTDADFFEVVEGQLKFKDNTSADYETQSSYSVSVTATDSGSLTYSDDFSVTVNDINEAPTAISLSSSSIGENSAGAVVGTLSTIDIDSGDSHTYVLSGTDKDSFEIVAGQLKLKAAVSADYETKSSYAVTVTATDSGDLTYSDDFTVIVNDVNDAAVIGGDTTGSVIEDALTSTVFGTATHTDVDSNNGDNVFLSVASGTGSNKGYGTYGVITAGVWTYTLNNSNSTVSALSASATLTDTVTVTAEDGTTKDITVTITGANDAAVIGGDTTGSVTEDASTSTVFGTATHTDVDSNNGDNVFLSVASGTGSNKGYGTYGVTTAGVWTYTLNNSNSTVSALSASATLTDTVTVTAEDGTAKDITVTITGTNDVPVITSSSSIETPEQGVGVSTVVVTDAESDAVTYGLSGTDAALFSISTSGLLTFIEAPDYEGDAPVHGSPHSNEYNLTVTASDGLLAVDQAITVTVTNVEGGPVFLSTSAPSRNENQVAIVTLVASDDDNDEVSFSITGGEDQESFSLFEEGVLTFTVAPDYEIKSSYQVTVTATESVDSNGVAIVNPNRTTQDLVVSINDINEAATGISLGTSRVDENSIGAVVGTLTTTDADDGDRHTYSLSGTDADSFEIVDGQLKLKDTVSTDYETKSSYTVAVTATDSGDLTYNEDFTVIVNDVNEAPMAIRPTSSMVEENIAGAVVGSLSATDKDNGDSHTFTLSGADAGYFEVVDGQLKLKDSVSADYETKSSYTLTVTTIDAGDLNYSTDFTVIVNDVNEVSGTVSSDSETSVQELYISYFGRPADPAGLAFYAESLGVGATTINAIASSFSNSTEAQAIIVLDTDAYLTAMYLQAFARAYDNSAGADGTFWFDAIERGATTKELAMVQILSGAQGADITAVANKVAVSKAFTNAVTTEGKTYAGAVNAAAVKAVLDAVTSDAVTMTSGKMAAQAMVTLLTSFPLASVVDIFVGAANDSTIDATAKVEVLAGRSGADSFVFATGDTGITLATADTITDFTTADDVITTSLVAGNVTIADGSGLTDFSAFVTAADAVLTSGAGIDDAYEAWDVAGTGNAWLVIDENDSGLVDAGDTLIILAGVNTADKFVLADIA